LGLIRKHDFRVPGESGYSIKRMNAMTGPGPTASPAFGGAHAYRSIFISDLHLGTRGCRTEFLADFLRRVSCSQMYLVGAILIRTSATSTMLNRDTLQQVDRVKHALNPRIID